MKPSSNSKKSVISKVRRIFLLLVILAAAGAAWFWTQRPAPNNGILTLYGNVDIREVQLAFRQPGRVAQMLFDEGDTVHVGDLIAVLDDQPYQDALAVASASVQVAQAELNKLHSGLRPQEIAQAQEVLNQAAASAREAERNYQRQKTLVASGATSQSVFDNAMAAKDQTAAAFKAAEAALSQAHEGFRSEDIAAGEARLAAAQAAHAQASTALADTKLLAPSNGTVITRVREPGSMVANQSAIYNLSLNTPVYVRAYVSEPDLGRINPGTVVQVRNDSSDKVYQGQIGFISPRAEFTPKTVETTELRTDLVYRLRIMIDSANAYTDLRQGMPVTIEVDTN